MSQTPTLQTIADAAGVSRMTVSRALNNHPHHNAKTCQRIQKIAKQLGYKSNPLVTAHMADLRSKGKKGSTLATIGILYAHSHPRPWDTDWIYKRWLAGIKDSSQRLGYTLDYFWLNDPETPLKRLDQILQTRGIKGLLFLPSNDIEKPLRLKSAQYSMVALGQQPTFAKLNLIQSHWGAGMELALTRLHKQKCKRIGFLSNPTFSTANRLWKDEYQHYCSAHKSISSLPAHTFSKTGKWNAKALTQWCLKHKPDVILGAIHSEQLEHFNLWLAEIKKHSLPKLRFVQMDRTPAYFPHSGINQCPQIQGGVAFETLAAQLIQNRYGVPTFKSNILVNPKWQQ